MRRGERMGKMRKWCTLAPASLFFLFGMLLCGRYLELFATLLAALFHECGHLLAARALKIPLRGISLDLFGARISVGRLLSYGDEWLLAASGPFASFVASAGGALFWERSPFFFAFSAASFLLGVFNLLPIRSLDGGRMLDAALSFFVSPEKSRAVLSLTSALSLFFVFSASLYPVLRRGVGSSLFFFSTGLLFRFILSEKNEIY